MAENSISPGFMKLIYSANGHPHTATYGLKLNNATTRLTPGDTDIEIINKGGDVVMLLDLTPFLWNVLKPFFKTTDNLTYIEVWDKRLPTDDPIFINVFDVDVDGTSTSPNVPNGQFEISIRTLAGGIQKIYLMEGVTVPTIPDRRPFGGAAQIALAEYLEGEDVCVFARDNSYPLLCTTINTKYNDALRKKYFLGS